MLNRISIALNIVLLLGLLWTVLILREHDHQKTERALALDRYRQQVPSAQNSPALERDLLTSERAGASAISSIEGWMRVLYGWTVTGLTTWFMSGYLRRGQAHMAKPAPSGLLSKIATAAMVLGMVAALGIGIATHFDRGPLADQSDRNLYLRQLENNDEVPRLIREEQIHRNNDIRSQVVISGSGAGLLFLVYYGVIRRWSARKPAGSPEF